MRPIDAFVQRRQILGKYEHDFTSRMTMHTLDRRDNLQDSTTAFAANNSFGKLCEKLHISAINRYVHLS